MCGKTRHALDFPQTTTHQLNQKLTDIWFPDLQNEADNTYLLSLERTLKMVQLCSQVTDYYYYYYYYPLSTQMVGKEEINSIQLLC